MWAINADPKVSFCIGYKSAHSPNRRRVRQGAPNQSKSKSIEADQTTFRSNPEVAVIRLADGIDYSSQESLAGSPLIVDVLRYCPGGVQSASRVYKTNARDPGQQTAT